MKKLFVSLVVLVSVVLLTWCGKTPEQSYIEELEVQTAHLETLGNAIMSLGDQMIDEDFNQAFTTLTLIQDTVDTSNLPIYAWADDNLKTSSEELHTVIDLTREFVSVLRPVLSKVAENSDYVPTSAEVDALENAWIIVENINTHMQIASDAFDKVYPEEIGE